MANRHPFLIIPAIILCVNILSACARSAETHAGPVSEHILALKKQILSTLPDDQKGRALFVTFWDMDGTILKGDCTEGLVVDGKTVYKGLAQKTIEAGLSKEYPPASYRLFAETVRRLKKTDNRSYLLLYPRALADNEESGIIAFSEGYFGSVLKKYLFRSSIDIMKSLQKGGVGIYVISASAHVYVRGAACVLGIPPENIRGIMMKSRSGRMTREPVLPLTCGPGKTVVLKEIVAELERKNGAPVFVLAGFGNSFDTDGDFMDHVAALKLPAGKTMPVMINGGAAPGKYRGRFVEVVQDRVLEP